MTRRPLLRLLLGVVAGAVLLAAAATLWAVRVDRCLGRCGAGTRCAEWRCVALELPSPASAAVAPVARRRTRRPALAPAAAEEQLRPGDEKLVTQGDALGRPERVDFTAGGDDARELSQDDLDRVWKAREPAISRCITEALGDAPLESGRVEVGLRIEKAGEVSRVRVEAPQLLQRRGLSRCVRGVATTVRFPASGGATVVSYPFALQ